MRKPKVDVIRIGNLAYRPVLQEDGVWTVEVFDGKGAFMRHSGFRSETRCAALV